MPRKNKTDTKIVDLVNSGGYKIRQAAQTSTLAFQILDRYVRKLKENPNCSMVPNYLVNKVFPPV